MDRAAPEPSAASMGKGAVKNKEIFQPRNEAKDQPVTVVANTRA